MSIQELLLKFKSISKNTEVLLTILIISVSIVSFLLGRASVIEVSRPTSLEKTDTNPIPSIGSRALGTGAVSNAVNESSHDTDPRGAYVASKSGTKYHLPWCGSAKQIKEENKIWFQTKEEAEGAGYTPASNCKGI